MRLHASLHLNAYKFHPFLLSTYQDQDTMPTKTRLRVSWHLSAPYICVSSCGTVDCAVCTPLSTIYFQSMHTHLRYNLYLSKTSDLAATTELGLVKSQVDHTKTGLTRLNNAIIICHARYDNPLFDRRSRISPPTPQTTSFLQSCS